MTEKKHGSGEHPAVAAFRAKLDSFDETTLPMLEELKDRVEKGVGSAPPETRPTGGAVFTLTIHASGDHVQHLKSQLVLLGQQVVRELGYSGHTINFASVTHGGEDTVIVGAKPQKGTP